VRLALWSKVRDLRAAGTTVLLTTHYMDEAQRLCDRVAIVANGAVIAEGAPLDLITQRLSPETVELDCTPAEEANLLRGFPPHTHRLRAGGRLMVYLDDPTLLVSAIHARGTAIGKAGGGAPGEACNLIVRPTNLEDVFLAMTGATLEGGA
jgi:lipooligosaccharide transport system ATP-binding protein